MYQISITLIALLLLAPVALGQPDKDGEKALLETAEEVVQANIQAVGGRAACEAVHSIRINGTRITDSPMGGGKMTSSFVENIRYPGFLHNVSEMETPMGSMTITRVRTPDATWVEAGRMGRRELPVRPSMTLESACPELTILDIPEFAATGMETGPFDGHEVYVVFHEADGQTLRRYYDQDSLLLLAAERISAGGEDGADPELVKYGDYQEVGGLLMSHAQDEVVTMTMISRTGSGDETETTHRGESSVTIENVVINPDIDESLFRNDNN